MLHLARYRRDCASRMRSLPRMPLVIFPKWRASSVYVSVLGELPLCRRPKVDLSVLMSCHLHSSHAQSANAIGGRAGTAPHSALYAGHVEVVFPLLRVKGGVDIDPLGIWDRSPLQLASYKGNSSVVQRLLGHGADAHFRDKGDVEIVRVVLEHNAGTNSQDKYDQNPIHWALYGNSEGDYPQIVRLSLEHGGDGANLKAQDHKRRTPLYMVPSSSLVSPLQLEVSCILFLRSCCRNIVLIVTFISSFK
ncbi:ankyrin repeat-containing domain protein [Lactarius vividus]|nr:ankyrin repeat-containing domain protein [Lactarius vividus]